MLLINFSNFGTFLQSTTTWWKKASMFSRKLNIFHRRDIAEHDCWGSSVPFLLIRMLSVWEILFHFTHVKYYMTTVSLMIAHKPRRNLWFAGKSCLCVLCKIQKQPLSLIINNASDIVPQTECLRFLLWLDMYVKQIILFNRFTVMNMI